MNDRSQEPAPFDGMRVLIADDNPALRGLLRVALQAFGCARVVEAEHGEAALDAVRAQAFDLVITDWRMRPMDGEALIRALRDPRSSPQPGLRILMLTGYADAAKARAARQAGADGFVIKPFTSSELAGQIRTVFSRPVHAIEHSAPATRRDASSLLAAG